MDVIGIERSIWINAARERVWEAITDPAQIAQWFAPGMTFKTSGTGVGSRLYIEDPETGGEMYVQILEVYEPPSRLATRSQATPPEPSFVTSYQLEAVNGGTQLTLSFSGYEGLPEEMRQPMIDENSAGFELMLQNVKAYVEGTDLPAPQGF